MSAFNVSAFPFGFKYRAFWPAWKGASRCCCGLISGAGGVVLLDCAFEYLIKRQGKHLLCEMTAQVHCQHCGHDFEAEVDGKTTFCQACQKETPINAPIPKRKAIPQPGPMPTYRLPLIGSAAIRHKAEAIEVVSICLMGLGFVGLLFSFFAPEMMETGNDANSAFIACIVCASLLTIGIWAYLIAQILHIRANTHKD